MISGTISHIKAEAQVSGFWVSSMSKLIKNGGLFSDFSYVNGSEWLVRATLHMLSFW